MKLKNRQTKKGPFQIIQDIRHRNDRLAEALPLLHSPFTIHLESVSYTSDYSKFPLSLEILTSSCNKSAITLGPFSIIFNVSSTFSAVIAASRQLVP